MSREKKWDANAERDLCVALVLGAQDSDRMRYNWPNVHGIMEKLGYKFSKDAISYVFFSFLNISKLKIPIYHRQHFTKVMVRDFKARHGDIPMTPSSSKKRKLNTDDKEERETVDGTTTPVRAKSGRNKAKVKVEDQNEAEADVKSENEDWWKDGEIQDRSIFARDRNDEWYMS